MPPLTDLNFQNVTLKAGPVTILREVTFHTTLQGVTLLSGRNGAGKTTLLCALLGLHRLEKGRIYLGNAEPAVVRSQIGYMPQSNGEMAAALPAFSQISAVVWGNRWGFSLSTRARRAEVVRVLSLTGAEAFAARPFGALSGGERRRILLAQALVGQPRLLLLDEPLAGLDLDAQEEVVSLLKKLTRELGIGVLMTSHETACLQPIVARVLNLGDGHLNACL